MPSLTEQFKSDKRAIRRGASEGLRVVAETQLKKIQGRLNRGISSTGAPFVPYARSTARRKGRFKPVTLKDKGNMRASMYVRRIRLNNYEITFKDRQNEKIARFQHGGTRRSTRLDRKKKFQARNTRKIIRNTGKYHIPPRPFIEATKREIKAADKNMEIQIANEFPSDLRRRIKITVRA